LHALIPTLVKIKTYKIFLFKLILDHRWAEIELMHDKINVGQNNNTIIISSKFIYFFKIKLSRWFEFNNEINNFKYAAEKNKISIIIFSETLKYC
jgi:hypothetical protein